MLYTAQIVGTFLPNYNSSQMGYLKNKRPPCVIKDDNFFDKREDPELLSQKIFV